MKKRLFIFLLAAVLVLGTGCGSKEQPAAASSTSSTGSAASSAGVSAAEPDVSAAASVELPYVPSGTNPLTGLPMEEAYETLRPVAVMLNDLKAAQPQLGVSRADMIYEVPAEGGITRMVAVYQSLDGVENLGSIRSTRAYYLELALGHDALLVHAGGSPEAYSDIPKWGVDNMDGVNGGSDAAIFWRDAERRKTKGYEHSLLTSGEKIQAYLDAGHFRTEHEAGYTYPQTFAQDGTPANGTAAERFSVKYSNYKTTGFAYDATTGTYQISQYGGAYIDGNTGEQVGVTNVLVLETSMSLIAGDTYGRITVQLTGSGKGTFFCGGKSVPIRWEKASRDQPFVYRTENGAPLVLGQGSSYVCIMSGSRGVLTVE